MPDSTTTPGLTADVLLRKRVEQRTEWFDLPRPGDDDLPMPPGYVPPPRKRVQIRRPLEAEFPRFIRGATPDVIACYVVGWEGFTEADLVTSGGSDPAPFSPDLWADVMSDHLPYITAVGGALVTMITAHLDRQRAIRGN